MKTINLFYPLTLAVAVTLAGTGCHHASPKTTPLPGPLGPPITEVQPTPTAPQEPPSGTTLPPENPPGGVTITPTPPPAFPTNGIATSEKDFSNMTPDRTALQANTVHFAFDSAVIKSSEQPNIDAVAAYLTSNPNDCLMIEGNCDERGTEEYNRSLGERRALALREALAAKNIDPQRVRTISFGKDKPVDPGHDEAAFAKNRRGDFVVYHPKATI